MPKGGGLWVSAERVGGEAVVRVRDSGEGIPDAVMENLFKPFNTSKAGGGGTGLGLAFCGMAVRAHGGRIEVESEVGAGSTFTVKLPAG
jgi:signal transduction histidine kinase